MSETILLLLFATFLLVVGGWAVMELGGKIARQQIKPFLEPLHRLVEQFGGTMSAGFIARTFDAKTPSFRGIYAGFPITGTLSFSGSYSLNIKISEAFKVHPASLVVVLRLKRPSTFDIAFINDSFNKVLFGKTLKSGDPELDRKCTLYTPRLDPAKRFVADSKNLGAIREIYHQGWELHRIGKKTVNAGVDFKWGEFDAAKIGAEPVKKCLDQLIILAEGLKQAA